MFFRKSGKTNEEGSNKPTDVQLPPIPGAESRPEDQTSINNGEDENDSSNKQEQSTLDIPKNEEKEKPSAYIKPANFDFWVRALDVNGLVYYYNTKSGESTWLAPCIVCYTNGERYCLKCTASFCDKHFQKKHKYLDNPDEHLWSTQEQQTEREELENPEEQEYCIECQLKVANRLCIECWDPYCQRCFELVHHVGNLKTHGVMTYGRAHEGWYTVRRYETEKNSGSDSMKMIAQAASAVSEKEGAADGGSFVATGISQRPAADDSSSSKVVKNASSKPGVMEYYVHGTTKEVTYEKPIELMSDLEKVLLQNWKLHQSAAESYVTRIDELQFDLEKVTYERDTLKIENAQMAQGIMPNQGGGKKFKSGKNVGSSKQDIPVLEKLIEGEGDEYRQKLLHPNDRKRGEARANFMKSLLDQPLPGK